MRPCACAFSVTVMRTRYLLIAMAFSACVATLESATLDSQTIDEACSDRGSRLADSRVRVAWTEIDTGYDDVRVSYCVLRGDATAKLDFERDAEIVYFGLASVDRKADRRVYTFAVRTSTGRVLRQGPALIQPVAKQLASCRVDVCQFFTDPGERVISVFVETNIIDR
jgi:hypothetical protein